MKSLNAKRIAAVAASLLVGLALAGSVSFSNIPIINSAGQPVVQIVVGSQAKPSDGVVAANIAAVIGNLAYTSTPVTATVNGAGALTCSVTTPTCTLTNKQVYLGVRGLVAPSGSYEISALIGSVLNGGVFSTGNLQATKSLDNTGTYSFAKSGTGLAYTIPSTSTPSPYEGVNNYIPITAVTPSQNGGGVSFSSFTTYVSGNYYDNLVGITNAYVSGLMSASGPYSATEELFISGFPVYDQAINNFALLDANGAYQITFGSPVPMNKSGTINHAQITFLGENWTIYNYNTGGLTTPVSSGQFVVGGKLQLAQSMTPLTTVFVGQNLTSGPFTVKLLDLSYPNSNGISQADVAVYKNGIMYNQTAVYPQTTTEFNVSGTPIYLYVSQTFPGLYASQKWAKMQLFSNIMNLTSGDQFNSANPTWNVALRWTSNQSSPVNLATTANAIYAELEGIVIYGNTTTGKDSNYMTLTPGQSMTFITNPAVWKVTFAGDSLGTPSAGNSNYDALTFSTSSSSSFTYQNPVLSQTTSYDQWNGIGFNGIYSVQAVPAGNVTAITEPANLFTVTSSIPTAFTIQGKSTATSTLLYNLDTYELYQEATVANTQKLNPSTSGVNVILYNNGVNSLYYGHMASTGTPLIVTISGYANGAPASTQVQFTSFPAAGKYVSATSSQLFNNITNVELSYPFPAPGVNVIVFDSANTATPAFGTSPDTTNNVEIADLQYAGPTLTYTAPGVSYNKISTSLQATYSGESGFSTPMTLAQLKSVAPTAPTAYFNFYFPEYDLPTSQALSSNIMLQLTNASTTTPPSVGSALYYLNYTPTLGVSGAINYTSSSGNAVKAPAGFRTERGSMVASITPTQVTYDLAKSVDMLQFVVGPANTTISTAEHVIGPFAVGAQALPNVTIANVTANCTFSTTSCTVNGISNLTATPSVSEAITPVKLNTAATPLAVLDTNANQASTLIVIGSKYVNSIAAQIFAQNPSLNASFGPGSVIVQAFGTNRILVAGYTANETVQAGNEFIEDLLTAAGQ
ncbi:MAG: S-layer protein [Candidatus Micrarchaeota archaeon]